MASSWIKLEVITPDKPEVYQLAEILNIDPDAVLGKLFRIWCWADQHTTNGNAGSVTKILLDRVAYVSGFADALLSVGWLKNVDGALVFPNFERHNGESSKKRALTNRRVAEHRKVKRDGNASRNAASVTSEVQKALPEEEEEEYISNNSSSDNSDELPGQAEQDKTAAFLAKYPEAVGGCYTPSGSKWGSAQDRECAQWIYDRVLMVNSAAKEPNWPAWSNDIRLMRQADGRNHKEICELFKWANQDSFWQANILSPAKLREKWDTLAAKRNSGPSKLSASERFSLARKINQSTDW